ncbi:MAG: DUF4115 domain-containing protein [Rhodospirillum sp.]|nr:DUF4115 domain-containing protein [Rhodospirillum sp.]
MDTSSGNGVAGEKQGSSGQVGAVLRAARLRLGEPLESAAEVLRIRLTYLEAIEDGRYGELPGVAYAIGFVRAYADHLGLHAEEVVRRFKEESQSQTVTNSLDFPVPSNEGGLPAGAMVAFALVLAGCAYGAWYWISTSEKPVAELIPDIPERLASMVGGGKSEESTKPDGSSPEKATSPSTAPPVAFEPASDGEGRAPKQDDETAGAGTDLGGRDRAGLGDPLAPLVVEQVAQAPSTPVDGVASQSPVAGSDGGVTVKPEPPAPEAVVEPAPEPALEAVVEPAPEPVVEPAPEPVVEPAPEPALEAVVEPAPEAAVEPAPEPTPEAVVKPAPEPAVAPAPEAAVEPAPNPQPAPDAGTAPPPPPAAEVEETPRVESFVGQAAPSAVTVSGQGAKIILRATNDTWIQVRKGGDLVVRRLLRSGDIYGVPSTDGLSLNVTNAGALEVYVDGKRAPSLGPAGAVRNNISLSPNRLKSGR